MKTLSIILLFSAFIISGCAWFEESEHERIVGEYLVGWNDLVQNRCITKYVPDCDGCYGPVVGDYVFAVGNNDNFIIAKRLLNADTSKTFYYIIDIKKNKDQNGTKGVYEFSNLEAFERFREKVDISNIAFDKTYPKNP